MKFKTFIFCTFFVYLCTANSEDITCNPVVDPADQCPVPVGSSCVPNNDAGRYECLCPSGQTEHNDKCATECTTGSECSGNEICDKAEVCVDCKDTGFPNADKDECLEYATEIGGDCEDDGQCSKLGTSENGPLAMCYSIIYDAASGRGECMCVEDVAVPTKDNSKCVKIINWGDDCEDDAQCPTDATCADTNKCTCDDGYVESNEEDETYKCYPIISDIGSVCKVTEQCNIDHAECIGGDSKICNCTTNFIASGNRCLELASIVGGECENPIQCLSLGNANSTECIIISGAYGLCRCKSGSYESEDHLNCFQYADSVGDKCNHPEQCTTLGIHAECRMESVEAEEKQCLCKVDTIPSTDLSECLPTIYDWTTECSEHSQCHLLINTVCIAGAEDDTALKCRCETDFTPFTPSDGTPAGCLSIVYEQYKPCDDGVQCKAGIGDLSICNDNKVCDCTSGAMYSQELKKCFKPSQLNGYCTDAGECQVGTNSTYAECGNNRLCQCKSNSLTWDGSCYAKKEIGDSCNSDLECQVPIRGESLCDRLDRKCDCKIGYYPDFSRTLCASTSALFKPLITLMFLTVSMKFVF